MKLFGPRPVADEVARQEVAQLRDELVRVQSVVRQIEQEVIGMHDQVRRWMRRAVAAERAVTRNQDAAVSGNGTHTPATPAPAVSHVTRLSLRGARARIAARRRLEAESAILRQVSEGEPAPHNALPAAEAPLPESQTTSTEGNENGLHS